MTSEDRQYQIQKKLDAFDSIGEVLPSADWDAALLRRLENAQSKSQRKSRNMGISAVGLIFILINAGVLFYTSQSNSGTASIQKSEYETLSEQFLINPIITQ